MPERALNGQDQEVSMTDTPTKTARARKPSPASNDGVDYVTPITHTHVPGQFVDIAFWGGLVGAVALGVIDPPLGILVGAGVLVARHRS
jgi:hypothetical protein